MGLVFSGNFLGAFMVAVLMAIYFTYGFSIPPSAVGEAISEIGHDRTVTTAGALQGMDAEATVLQSSDRLMSAQLDLPASTSLRHLIEARGIAVRTGAPSPPWC